MFYNILCLIFLVQQSYRNGGLLREKELEMKKILRPIKRCLVMQEMPF